MSPQLVALSSIWSAARRRCPAAVADCLFRMTDGSLVERVRRHGTDRFGLDRPVGCAAPPWGPVEWRREGFQGPLRPFADVLYASTAAEIDASLAGTRASSAILKIPVTDDPHLLVYRRAAFAAVHAGQYAFRDPGDRRAALLAVWSVADLRRASGSGAES